MRRRLIGTAVGVLAFAAVAQGGGFAGFATQQSFATGTNPRQTVVADFDGDGALDLATCNANSNDVAVLKGNGDATFGAPVFYAAGQTPLSVKGADIDGDGDIDLTVAAGNGVSITVLANSGDGTFVTQQTFAFNIEEPPYPGVIMVHAMADFDADGDIDIALVTLTATLVIILPNDGSGTFGPYQVIDEVPGPGFPADMEPGDFNGDGNIDLLLIRGYFLGTGARMLLNNGDGTWSASELAAEADGIVSPPADFDGDGILDVALTRTINPGGYLLVAMGNGDGTFGPSTSYNVNRPYPPTTCDIDGDGDIDLIVPSFSPYNTVSVMLNNGDGTFANPLPFSVGGNNPQDVVAADLDGDSWPDLVNANRGGNNVSVLINLSECPTDNRGDLNCDGVIDFFDIDPFLTALFDLPSYLATHCGGRICNADIDCSGTIDFFDVDPMLACLFGASGCASCP